jgi:hypothetical protein
MMTDTCTRCHNAPCLEACPTGALFKTEFDTAVVQQDICNSCACCVPPPPVRLRRYQHPRRQGAQMHAALRSAQRRSGAGLCQILSDRFDSVRRSKRSAATGARAGPRIARSRGHKRLPLWYARAPRATGDLGHTALLLGEASGQMRRTLETVTCMTLMVEAIATEEAKMLIETAALPRCPAASGARPSRPARSALD